MCTGAEIALISAATTAGGTALQAKSQSDTQKDIRRAQQAADEANDLLQQQSQAEVLDTAEDFSREKFEDIQAQETGKIGKKFADVISGDLPGQFSGGTLASNTQRLLEEETSRGRDEAERFAAALADLRGFGQGLTESNRGIQRAGENIALNRGAQAGNAAVLPITIQGAIDKSSNPFADILVAGGSAGLQSGLGKKTVKTGGGGTIKGGVPTPGRKPSQFAVV